MILITVTVIIWIIVIIWSDMSGIYFDEDAYL